MDYNIKYKGEEGSSQSTSYHYGSELERIGKENPKIAERFKSLHQAYREAMDSICNQRPMQRLESTLTINMELKDIK